VTTQKYRLNTPARTAIAHLRDKYGIEPTPDEIVLLYEAGKAMLRPDGINSATLLNLPVITGSLRLYPLTVGAELWLHDYGLPVCEGNDRMTLYVVAYAAAYSQNPYVLAEATSSGILKTVGAWAESLSCTIGELEQALEIVMPRTTIVDDLLSKSKTSKPATLADKLEEERKATAADGYGPIIALLVQYSGKGPDYWLFHASHDEALYHSSQIVERLMREAGEKSTVMAPLLRAQRAMSVAVNQIVAAHKSQGAQNG
jgi:hypothetical protein